MPLKGGLSFLRFQGGDPYSETVILIHGIGGEAALWPAELRRLPGYNVIAVDLPGHGRSPGNALQTVRAHAEALLEFMAALGLYRAVLIGHSLGGAVALHLALEFPHHVTGLGLVAAAARFQIPDVPLLSLDNPTLRHEVLKTLESWILPPWLSLPVRRQVDLAFKQLRPEVRAADWKAIAEFDVRDRLSELRMPTSVLYGTRDPLVPLSGVRGFIGTSGVVNAESLEQAGHWLMLEQPGVVAAWLRRFLSLVNALAHRSSDDFREFKAPLQPKNWEANKPES